MMRGWRKVCVVARLTWAALLHLRFLRSVQDGNLISVVTRSYFRYHRCFVSFRFLLFVRVFLCVCVCVCFVCSFLGFCLFFVLFLFLS